MTLEYAKKEMVRRYKYLYENAYFILAPYMYEQTEEEFNIQKEHDKRKREYARNNGINLLEIWYWDMKNIENIIKNYLKISI